MAVFRLKADVKTRWKSVLDQIIQKVHTGPPGLMMMRSMTYLDNSLMIPKQSTTFIMYVEACGG